MTWLSLTSAIAVGVLIGRVFSRPLQSLLGPFLRIFYNSWGGRY